MDAPMNISRVQWCAIACSSALALAIVVLEPSSASAATITASPNPCTIESGQTTCTSTISWSASSTQVVQIWPSGLPVSFACTAGPSSKTAPWITSAGVTLNLYQTTTCADSVSGRTPDASVIVIGSPIYTASAYSSIRSVTWYEFGPTYAESLADLRAQIPRMKAAGFNTVWLVTPWMDMQPQPLASPPVWNEANFTALKQTLAMLRANNMQALIGLNYLGPEWEPQGIDACTWTTNTTMYQAFVDYAKGFLQRIDGYQDVAMIQVFTENAEPIYMPSCPENTLNEKYDGPQIAKILRGTLGNLPAQLPSTLRAKWRIGYHDFSQINFGWGQVESRTDAEMKTEVATRAARFKMLYPSTPLIIGEYGARSCGSSREANQARVTAGILRFAIANHMGSNVWAWGASISGRYDW